MTAPKAKPALRRDTAPYRALERLYEAGGSAPVQSFIDLVTSARNRQYLLRERILQPLITRCLILADDDTVHMMQPGYAFMRSIREREPTTQAHEQQDVVPSRVAPEFKPLPMDALRSTARRPGADDYRRIPSLMGGNRIERRE